MADVDDPQLIATLAVTFARRRTVAPGLFGAGTRAGTDRDIPMRLGRGPSLSAIGAYRRWASDADNAGFPVGGMAMILGVTEHELVVFTSRFFRSRPKRPAGMIPLREIAQMTAMRSLVSGRVVVLLANGSIVELETSRVARARRFVDTVLAQRGPV